MNINSVIRERLKDIGLRTPGKVTKIEI